MCGVPSVGVRCGRCDSEAPPVCPLLRVQAQKTRQMHIRVCRFQIPEKSRAPMRWQAAGCCRTGSRNGTSSWRLEPSTRAILTHQLRHVVQSPALASESKQDLQVRARHAWGRAGSVERLLGGVGREGARELRLR